MKLVKIKKAWLKEPTVLLQKVGATHGNRAFPSDVYASKEDVLTMRKNLKALAKKQGLNGRGAILAAGLELLNYGPNETLAEAIRPGYVLIDEDSINDAIKED